MTTTREKIYTNYTSLMYSNIKSDHTLLAKTWSKPYKYYLREWLPENKKASIVDLACGRGYLLWFFNSLGYSNLSGVDISKEQIEAAQKITKKAHQSDLFDYLENHSNTFDFITAVDIIEHLKKDECLCFLEQAYCALKNNGRIVIQTINADSPWCTKIRYGDITHETALTPDLLKHLMSAVGFSTINVREAGPVVSGFKSFMRYLLWKILRICLSVFDIIETGDRGSAIYTRVFLISGIKNIV
jgi:2-polyprenyl-3-methyl-5-hydroxy-6-metoxy-1,4-benzoquinol methylase